jgi:hypothetical protein
MPKTTLLLKVVLEVMQNDEDNSVADIEFLSKTSHARYLSARLLRVANNRDTGSGVPRK